MKCPNCKTENPPEERFCWRCHVPLEEEFRPQWGGFSAIVAPNRRPLLALLALAVVCAIVFGILAFLRSASPTGPAQKFLSAAESGDTTTMYALVSEPSRRVVRRADLQELFPQQGYGKVRFQVLGSKVTGNRADVRVAPSLDMPETSSHPGALVPGDAFGLPMVKESKGWRVDALALMRAHTRARSLPKPSPGGHEGHGHDH